MKKIIFLFFACFAVFFCSCESDNGSYIDLGLPSGTLWKSANENGFFSFDEARKSFHKHLPTKEQYEELVNQCRWRWDGQRHVVTGPNGATIFLPASGYYNEDGEHFNNVNHNLGCYWTATPKEADNAYCLEINSRQSILLRKRYYKYTVRLIK